MSMAEAERTASLRFREERYPPYDAAHGTPHAMIRRVLEFELPAGKAMWEQTDYGHPGRFNPWDPRGIDTRLQPKTAQLRAAAEAIGALVE
jgi:hypothetical protein